MKRKIVFIIIFILIIVGSVWTVKDFGPDAGKDLNTNKKEENIVVSNWNNTIYYLQRTKDGKDEWSFEVMIQGVSLQEHLQDEDGYYAGRGKVNSVFAYPYQGKQMVYESVVRYIVVDLEIKNKKENEQVYDLSMLSIANVLDNGTQQETAYFPADYKILQGEDNVREADDGSTKNQRIYIKPNEAVKVQLVYVCRLMPEFTLYNPCINLADMYTVQEDEGTLKACYVSLNLELYETDYPLSYTVTQSDARQKANKSVQDTDNALYKAVEGYTNREIAVLEEKNPLDVPEDMIVPEGSTLYDGMKKNGEIDRNESYMEIQNVTAEVYDSMTQLPEYFADSEALKKMTVRYAADIGCSEDELFFLKIKATYLYHNDTLSALHWHPLSATWLYDRKTDGSFYAYGYPDDYWILESETEGNSSHSSYLYMNQEEAAVVELVYVIVPDSYEELYLSSFVPLLWQGALDGTFTTQFMKVLDQAGGM